MKKLIAIAAVLAASLSIGTTIARADGGETGGDAAHTQSNWSANSGNYYTGSTRTWNAQVPNTRYRSPYGYR